MSKAKKILCALCLPFPYTAFAKSGSVNYSWGADALATMHDFVVTMMLYVQYICCTIAGVYVIVSVCQIYIKMNTGEDGITKSIMTLVGACLFAGKETDIRKVDCNIYKGILYQLEIRQVFLDTSLSLKKLSALLETNQTYLSNVVNKYFGCNLKELVNTYRVEYAKELLCSRRCALTELPCSCGFASKSAFYSAFSRIVGVSPLSYQTQERRRHHLQAVN